MNLNNGQESHGRIAAATKKKGDAPPRQSNESNPRKVKIANVVRATKREREIIMLIAGGLINKWIG